MTKDTVWYQDFETLNKAITERDPGPFEKAVFIEVRHNSPDGVDKKVSFCGIIQASGTRSDILYRRQVSANNVLRSNLRFITENDFLAPNLRGFEVRILDERPKDVSFG